MVIALYDLRITHDNSSNVLHFGEKKEPFTNHYIQVNYTQNICLAMFLYSFSHLGGMEGPYALTILTLLLEKYHIDLNDV